MTDQPTNPDPTEHNLAAVNLDDVNLADLRVTYETQGLEPDDVDPDPMRQFARWFAEVSASPIEEPNAVVLATADVNGRPSARHVLAKGVSERGFVIYTNYTSRKAVELDANPFATLVFVWSPLARQVVVEGSVERTDPAESDAYCAARPRGSQLGAWASDQSTVIDDRGVLERRYAELEQQHRGGEEIPRPDFWGGYRIVPDAMEFWQGRPSRLHDRLRYTRQAEGSWQIERLSP